MGDAALHLDLFEHPGRKRVFQHSAERRGAVSIPAIPTGRTRSAFGP